MDLLLFIIAWLLKNWLVPLLVIFSMVISLYRGGWPLFFEYCITTAKAIDKFGNAIGAPLWNMILIRKGGYQFGNINETISHVLALNEQSSTLLWPGKVLCLILEVFDPGHLSNALIGLAILLMSLTTIS